MNEKKNERNSDGKLIFFRTQQTYARYECRNENSKDSTIIGGPNDYFPFFSTKYQFHFLFIFSFIFSFNFFFFSFHLFEVDSFAK